MSLTDFTGNAHAPQKCRQMEHLTQVGTSRCRVNAWVRVLAQPLESGSGPGKEGAPTAGGHSQPGRASWPGHSGTSFTAVCAQSCPTLCDPTDCSPPGSSVHGVSQARILEWVAMPSSRESSQPRDRTCVSCMTGGSSTTASLGKPR